LRPFALLAAGYGMTEAPVPNVIVTPNDPNDANDTSTTPPILHGVTAWKLGGPTFAEAGVGAGLTPSARIGLSLAPEVSLPAPPLILPAPTCVLTAGVETGLKFGF